MLKLVGKWLKVYEEEISLFLWIFFLFFLLRSSNVILNNYAETAFLKRYGVEYLPIVYMLNSIALFFIMFMRLMELHMKIILIHLFRLYKKMINHIANLITKRFQNWHQNTYVRLKYFTIRKILMNLTWFMKHIILFLE